MTRRQRPSLRIQAELRRSARRLGASTGVPYRSFKAQRRSSLSEVVTATASGNTQYAGATTVSDASIGNLKWCASGSASGSSSTQSLR